MLIDATHPYAAVMSANAVGGRAESDVRFVALRRPPWVAAAGDRWIEVETRSDAVRRSGKAPRRVFLALGRQELAPFAAAPQHHYLIRSVDPVMPPLAAAARDLRDRARAVQRSRGSRAACAAHAIDVVVSKNSGGTATYGKIAAARALGVEVIMLRRPPLPEAPAVETVDEVIGLARSCACTSRRRAACRPAASGPDAR